MSLKQLIAAVWFAIQALTHAHFMMIHIQFAHRTTQRCNSNEQATCKGRPGSSKVAQLVNTGRDIAHRPRATASATAVLALRSTSCLHVRAHCQCQILGQFVGPSDSGPQQLTASCPLQAQASLATTPAESVELGIRRPHVQKCEDQT